MCWCVCITLTLIICVDYVFCNAILELSGSRSIFTRCFSFAISFRSFFSMCCMYYN